MLFNRRHFIRQPSKLATPNPADFLNLLAAASRTGCNFHRGSHLRLKRSLHRYEEVVDFLAYFFDQLTLSVAVLQTSPAHFLNSGDGEFGKARLDQTRN